MSRTNLRVILGSLLVVIVSLAMTLGSCAQTTAPVMHTMLDITFVPGDSAKPDDLSDDELDAGVDLLDQSAVAQCDMSPSAVDGGDDKLFVAATTSSGAPYAAVRDSNGWSAVPVGAANVTALAATQYGTLPAFVAQLGDNTLVSSIEAQCTDALPSPSALFKSALTGSRPAVLGGTQLDVVFRGSINGDQRLFTTTYTGSWSTATTLGNFLSILPPAAVRVGTAVHVLFTGTDANIYDGVVNGSGGAATLITMASSNAGPVAVATSDGTTHLVWQGQDTNLYWAARPSGGAYGVPASLCVGQSGCLIASNLPPVVALDRSDAPVVAWVGKNGFVYTSRLDTTKSQWSAALAATNEATAIVPGISTGLPGDEVEIVYVRASDNLLRHVSEQSGAFGVAEALPGGNISTAPSLVLLVAP